MRIFLKVRGVNKYPTDYYKIISIFIKILVCATIQCNVYYILHAQNAVMYRYQVYIYCGFLLKLSSKDMPCFFVLFLWNWLDWYSFFFLHIFWPSWLKATSNGRGRHYMPIHLISFGSWNPAHLILILLYTSLLFCRLLPLCLLGACKFLFLKKFTKMRMICNHHHYHHTSKPLLYKLLLAFLSQASEKDELCECVYVWRMHIKNVMPIRIKIIGTIFECHCKLGSLPFPIIIPIYFRVMTMTCNNMYVWWYNVVENLLQNISW